MSYYERGAGVNVDGTPIFKAPEDERSEREVADVLERVWRCELRPFGKLSAIDWFAVRDERMVGLLELKSRSHPQDRYDTVFLNVRKWLALTLGEAGLGTPSIFVVRFTDALKSIRVSKIDATRHRIGGTSRIVKARSDIEPVIEVPVKDMSDV